MAIGVARLKFDDIANAEKALSNINDVPIQARLRLEIGRWVDEHPDSEVGRNLLRETVTRFSTFEPWLARNDISGLIPAVFKVLGAEAVHSIAHQLEDPFTAGNVYVMLSFQLQDTTARRQALSSAEKLAAGVREGDRDWALRWVFRGYQSAGLPQDAERVRRMASKDPEQLTREEAAVFAETDRVLAEAEKHLPQTSPDTPLERLRRFLDYKINDLKVVFLTDAARAGEINDPEIEEMIRGDLFQRVEAPRQPRLMSNTSSLDAPGMARFLFGRPVCRHGNDEKLLEGDGYCEDGSSADEVVRQMTGLFRDFGRLASPFSVEQVEQGLWHVFGYPFWLRDRVTGPKVPQELREDCLRSMVNPFRDYYLPREASYSGSAFFMWWDSLMYREPENRAEIETISLDVIRQILQLPGKGCQMAALHGLNHMYPNASAAVTVRQYLEEHRTSLTADEIQWIKACAEGAAL